MHFCSSCAHLQRTPMGNPDSSEQACSACAKVGLLLSHSLEIPWAGDIGVSNDLYVGETANPGVARMPQSANGPSEGLQHW